MNEASGLRSRRTVGLRSAGGAALFNHQKCRVHRKYYLNSRNVSLESTPPLPLTSPGPARAASPRQTNFPCPLASPRLASPRLVSATSPPASAAFLLPFSIHSELFPRSTRPGRAGRPVPTFPKALTLVVSFHSPRNVVKNTCRHCK